MGRAGYSVISRILAASKASPIAGTTDESLCVAQCGSVNHSTTHSHNQCGAAVGPSRTVSEEHPSRKHICTSCHSHKCKPCFQSGSLIAHRNGSLLIYLACCNGMCFMQYRQKPYDTISVSY